MHVYGIQKNSINDLILKEEAETDIENKLGYNGGRGGELVDWD